MARFRHALALVMPPPWRRDLSFGLSRELWLVQIGIFLNTLGWGAVLPFELIYLHEARGFAIGTAGLIVAALTGVGVVAAPLAGPLIDRIGARAVTCGAGLALAAGYAGLALSDTVLVAFAAAAVGGIGNGALLPAQSTLLANLAPADRRHRATAVSRVVTNAGFGIGGAIGGVVAALGLSGFVALFLLNAVTYLAYAAVLVLVVRRPPPREPVEGGYRQVLGDRAFVRLALANVAIIAVGWGLPTWLVPTFAIGGLGISPQLVGLLSLANAATVVVGQLPVARAVEGHRRVVSMAKAGLLIALACAGFVVAGGIGAAAYALLLVAAVVVGIAECLYTAALSPLVADLAPASIRGRYMAIMGVSWWVGLALAPAIGARLLEASAALAFGVGASAAILAAIVLLRLERLLPATARLTPRPSGPDG